MVVHDIGYILQICIFVDGLSHSKLRALVRAVSSLFREVVPDGEGIESKILNLSEDTMA